MAVLKKILTFILTLITLSFTATSAHAAVVINEVYPKPSDETNEWIELYNTGTESVSLDRWKLENIAGEKKEFIMNASSVIAGHSFLTLNRSQTNIALFDTGDTINLYDVDMKKVDSQTYASTVGTNRSAGRIPDGDGTWSHDCTESTKNAANTCVAPTATPSPLPTSSPAPTAIAAATSTPVPTYTPFAEAAAKAAPQVLGMVRTPTPTPLPPDLLKIEVPNTILVSKTAILQVLIVLTSWGLLVVIAQLRKRNMGEKKKKSVDPTSSS